MELRAENSIELFPSHRRLLIFRRSGGTREQHRRISEAGRLVRR